MKNLQEILLLLLPFSFWLMFVSLFPKINNEGIFLLNRLFWHVHWVLNMLVRRKNLVHWHFVFSNWWNRSGDDHIRIKCMCCYQSLLDIFSQVWDIHSYRYLIIQYETIKCNSFLNFFYNETDLFMDYHHCSSYLIDMIFIEDLFEYLKHLWICNSKENSFERRLKFEQLPPDCFEKVHIQTLPIQNSRFHSLFECQ